MPPEESPRLFVIFVPHEHPHSSRISAIPAAYTSPAKNRGAGNRRSTAAFILLPDDAEKERSRTVHDCYVGEFPVAIVGNQRLDYEGEEGMVRDGAHSVVGDAGGMGAADPGWVGEERVEAAVTSLRGKAMLARVGLGGLLHGAQDNEDVRRRGRYRSRHSERVQSSEWHLPAVSAGYSCQRCLRTKGTR